MYSVNLIIDTDVLKAVREVGRTAPGKMGVYVRTVALPQVRREVKRRFGVDPGPVSRPFIFATARSRRHYFAMMRGKLPYRRTGKTQRAWDARADLRQAEGMFIVYNPEPHSVYVYGPGGLITNRRQVPGHKRTGWGKNFDNDVIAVSELAQSLIITGWYEILTGAR